MLPKGTNLEGLPNILVTTSTNDPATPFEQGIVLGKALRGTVAIVANDSHCAYGTNDCATNLINTYLKDPVGFSQKVDSGFFNDKTVYTGASSMDTKDIYSKAIKGKECQLVSFRSQAGSTTTPTTPTWPHNPVVTAGADDNHSQAPDNKDKDSRNAGDGKGEQAAAQHAAAQNPSQLVKTGTVVALPRGIALAFLLSGSVIMVRRKHQKY